MKKLSETMVAESVAAKIFKIGSVVFEIWPFLPYNTMEFFCQHN